MKISYKHLVDRIPSKPSKEDISKKLLQLGHENTINGDILDLELTPNRGDCQSLDGILRDLNLFYDVNLYTKIYDKEIDKFEFDFVNNNPEYCPKISFLLIEVENIKNEYMGEIKNYFEDLSHNKNNFFTDISNYISYETGQPIHCYDATKIKSKLSLDIIDGEYSFKTLLDQDIKLTDQNLVFKANSEIINIAGIMGGKNSACDKETLMVIVECAYFVPEIISGKSVKYDLKSDAAHKFERGVDIQSHEKVLRRFAKLVENHSEIKKINLFSETYNEIQEKNIEIDVKKINKILGTSIAKDSCLNYLIKLGFSAEGNMLKIPSYRNDINNHNDLAEEIARAIGYDNIANETLIIDINKNKKAIKPENKIRKALSQEGFYEVINSPFVSEHTKNAVKIDNPLDNTRKFLRTSLQDSLVNNLLFNERRQKDSIKLYEISDLYFSDNAQKPSTRIGIIASGRAGKNYIEFSKKIDADTILKPLHHISSNLKIDIVDISRNDLETKLRNKIFYTEIELDDFMSAESSNLVDDLICDYIKFKPITDFPSSTRDLSFSVSKPKCYEQLQKLILEYKNDLIKEVYIFDFFINKDQEIKIGFRLTFQSDKNTVTDVEVNEIINNIVDSALLIDSVQLPGFRKD